MTTSIAARITAPTRRSVLIALAAGALALSACAATSEPSAPEPGHDERHDAVDCGYYEAKQCDPQVVVDYVLANAKDAAIAAGACAECGKALVEAGAIASTGEVEVVPLVWVAIGGLSCTHCVDFAEESGMIGVLECTISPCEYSEEARQKECEDLCGYEGHYGYVAQGSTACICTDNALEAECRVGCYSGYAVNESCGCDAIPPPEPPEPGPECSDTGDGYSCSSDPDSGMDRACCGGQCVIWECSACDSNPYCGG